MTSKTPGQPDDARKARLSAALRENLKRRKAQARGRAAVPAAEASQPDVKSGERRK